MFDPCHKLPSFRPYIANDVLKIKEEFILPRTRRLCLSINPNWYITTRKVKYLLGQCSSVLEKLELDITISSTKDGKNGKEEEQQQEEHEIWPKLKTLTLMRWEDTSRSKVFWSCLWKRCDHLETLEVEQPGISFQNLAEGMLAHMPNLSSITLGRRNGLYHRFTNNDMAKLLSSSRKGWKVVKIRYTDQMERTAKEALAKRFHTLEVLEVREFHGVYGDYLVQVLSSCPKLHTLAIQIENPHPTNTPQDLEANMFIDRDPNAGLVKTWACESSLKVLQVVVTGVPRPDLEGDEVVGKVYPGEGPTIQSQVYDRLARLTNMESLWLGHSRPNSSNSKKLWDCLEMSLESGLDKLSGLKGLKELSVSHMSTKIGLKELQWMIEHWPRLRAIYGLNGHYFFVRENEAVKATKWLEEHHPEIDLRLNRCYFFRS